MSPSSFASSGPGPRDPRRTPFPRTLVHKGLRRVRPVCSGGVIVEGERGMVVAVSTTLFAIAVAAFLVVFAVVYLVFRVKYFRTRVRGRGPFGMFAHPRHTFAQYDEEGEGVEKMDTEGSGADADRDDRQKFG
jgi:hypothetical protein